MWIIILILSIKLNMPTWFWILFTVMTIFRPFIGIILRIIEDEIMKTTQKNK